MEKLKHTGLINLKNAIKQALLLPGVYEMRDQNGRILYIGKAKSLKKRLLSYTRLANLPIRLQRMVAQIHTIQTTITQTENEALLLEHSLIQKHKPPYNVLLKDDSTFVVLALTHHSFPRLIKQRGRPERANIFGPYPSSSVAEEATQTLQRVFQLRTCTDHDFHTRKRPCLNFDMKLCSAPCAGYIDQSHYQNYVQQAEHFLNGESHNIQLILSKEMEEASQTWQFEKAANLRNRLAALTRAQSKQHIMINAIRDGDVIAIHHNHVRILHYRKHHLIGGTTHTLIHTTTDAAENLSVFIKQFYITHPAPQLILLNRIPNHMEEISEQLLRTRFEQPKRGSKFDIVQYALQDLLENRSTKPNRKQNHDGMSLNQIDGIGSKRKKALLHRFGSTQGIAQAAIGDIASVEGISYALAQKIYTFFRGF